MWDRSTLKEKGRAAFRRNYWLCVAVALLLSFCIGSSSGSASYNFTYNSGEEEYSFIIDSMNPGDILGHSASPDFASSMAVFGIVFLSVLLVVLIISLVLSLFVFGPLEVGCCNFFKKNAYENADFSSVSIAFKKDNYKNIMITMFLRNLYTFLWTLLFIIPGIVKSLEYRMVPYILADCPDMSRKDAFRISKEMMDGNKMDAFILDLSFFGWILLAVITCNIVGIFYVQPYMAATDAELFIAIREEYFNSQRVDVCE